MKSKYFRGFSIIISAMLLSMTPLRASAAGEMLNMEISGMIFLGNSQISYFNEADGTVSIVDCGSEMEGTLKIPAEIEGKPVTTIGEGAFYQNSGITELVLPDSITKIDDGAFFECTALEKINLPDRLKSIGESALFGCSSLTKLSFPDSISVIPESCCASCAALTDIEFPSKIKEIGVEAFANSKGFETLELPETLQKIGEKAFCNWITTQTVSIPAAVNSIGDYAFDGCAELRSITVADNNPCYTAENGVLFDKNMTTLLKYPSAKPETQYTIPDTVTALKGWAFVGAVNLAEINLANVQEFGEDTFYSCKLLTTATIPQSMTVIPSGAFAYCENLTEVIIPKGCTEIGDNAFTGCNALKTVKIPSSVEKIGNAALGYGYDADSESLMLLEDFALTVPYGSIAVKYAKINEISYHFDGAFWIALGIIIFVIAASCAAAVWIHRKKYEVHTVAWTPNSSKGENNHASKK